MSSAYEMETYKLDDHTFPTHEPSQDGVLVISLYR